MISIRIKKIPLDKSPLWIEAHQLIKPPRPKFTWGAEQLVIKSHIHKVLLTKTVATSEAVLAYPHTWKERIWRFAKIFGSTRIDSYIYFLSLQEEEDDSLAIRRIRGWGERVRKRTFLCDCIFLSLIKVLTKQLFTLRIQVWDHLDYTSLISISLLDFLSANPLKHLKFVRISFGQSSWIDFAQT